MTAPAVIALAFLGNALIYAGFALINARLLPGILARVYAGTSPLGRTLMMEVLFAVPANYVFALAFRMAPPVHASAAILGTLVVVMGLNAALLGTQVSPRMAAALLATLCACTWFAYGQAAAAATQG